MVFAQFLLECNVHCQRTPEIDRELFGDSDAPGGGPASLVQSIFATTLTFGDEARTARSPPDSKEVRLMKNDSRPLFRHFQH
jgi:hypothetical protein